jgi:hypothetical protein
MAVVVLANHIVNSRVYDQASPACVGWQNGTTAGAIAWGALSMTEIKEDRT